MTVICTMEVRCALCGTGTKVPRIISTSAFGPSDLDTRPPEPHRASMFARVQRCSKCGYCASEIQRAVSQAAKVVHDARYIKQLNDASYPEIANSFLCKALID